MTTAKKRREKRRAEQALCVVTEHGVVWTLVHERWGSEPNFIGGREVKQKVDARTYCYQMTCPCGRLRFAKPNTLYEVTLCRLCQRQERLAKRRVRPGNGTT